MDAHHLDVLARGAALVGLRRARVEERRQHSPREFHCLGGESVCERESVCVWEREGESVCV